MVGLILIVMGVIPNENMVVFDVDIIEVNHYYDDDLILPDGRHKHVFTQILKWKKVEPNKYVVVEWHIKQKMPLSFIYKGGYYRHIVWEGKYFACYRAKKLVVTHTTYDPELQVRDKSKGKKILHAPKKIK